jgi:HNH endonuclease
MDDCIEWTGTLNGDGYGVRNDRLSREQFGPSILVHRQVWWGAHGPIPPGQVIRHDCDNPRCINIEHLRLGTQSDNMQDFFERRSRRPAVRLTPEQRDQVRQLRSEGAKLRELVEKFGTSRTSVRRILASNS